MKSILPAILRALAAQAAAQAAAHADDNRAQWRGPLATGESPTAKPPVEWSETMNVRWKVELPGKGHSTPAVWGDRVFVTAASPALAGEDLFLRGEQFLYCLSNP